MKEIFRQSIVALLLTALMCSITVMFANKTRTLDWFILTFIISFISMGLPNVIFLLFIYFLKIGQIYLLKTKYLIIEIILLMSTFYLVNEAIDLIPNNIKFYHTSTVTGLRYYFQDSFIILYSFIILFLVVFIFDRIKKQIEKVNNGFTI